MKKSTLCGLLAFVCMVAPFVMITFGISTIRTIVVVGVVLSLVAFVLSIVGIVCGKKAKESKGFAIFTLILSIITTLMFLIALGIGSFIKDSSKTQDMCKSLVNCKYIGNDESICYMDGDTRKLIGVYCENSALNQDQYE